MDSRICFSKIRHSKSGIWLACICLTKAITQDNYNLTPQHSENFNQIDELKLLLPKSRSPAH